MRDYDLDAEARIRPRRPGRRPLLALTLLVGTTLAGIGTPQAGQQPAAIAATSAPTEHLPPSTETTGSIIRLAPPLRQQESATASRHSTLALRERHVLIALLSLCFAVLSVSGYALWRRSIAEFRRNPEKRSAIFGKE